MFDDFEGFENDEVTLHKELVFDGLKFVRTCMACPEQYDVYNEGGEQVGYVRLRWGHLRCDVPDVFGNTIYTHDFDDGYLGIFPDNDSRNFHLLAIAKAINGWKT